MVTIRFAGRQWRVKISDGAVGPGPNVFSAENVTVDARGRLQLRIARSDRRWSCAEVIGVGRFGYGTYRWTVTSDVTHLERQVVLGLFTWSDEPAQANREIDIEFSRWSERSGPVSGSFTVQRTPPATPASLTFATESGPGVHTLVWGPGKVEFHSRFGRTEHRWEYAGSDVPTPGGDVAPRMNLWLFRGIAPVSPCAITIESFSYVRP